jgi:hypothetical protein
VSHRLLGGVLSGAAGTAAMTTTGRIYREVHARRRGLSPRDISEVLDYDDSDHVVIAASTVLRRVVGWSPRGPRVRRALFWLVHWGYGSAVGAAHAELRHRLGAEPTAGLVFFLGCLTMALSLFPILGETPVPWRWGSRLLTVSLAQHAVYAGTVAGVDALLDHRAR